MSGDPNNNMSVKNKGTDQLPFGEILKCTMKERNLTLKQVAELAGVRISVVQGWISGANPHDLRSVQKLAKSLGISFESLLLGSTPQQNGIQTPAEVFTETSVFDGICRVSIKKLTPRNEN